MKYAAATFITMRIDFYAQNYFYFKFSMSQYAQLDWIIYS